MLLKIAPFWLVCLGAIGLLILVLHLIIRISGARRRTISLAQLHNDQRGGVQSLSFVLTLPVFIWIMMGVIQVSQIMLAQVVVEYAAIAAARAASVWTGEYVYFGQSRGDRWTGEWHSEEDTGIWNEGEGNEKNRNHIGEAPFLLKSQVGRDTVYTIDLQGENEDNAGNEETGMPFSKIAKIRRAAKLACLSIAPSRDTGYSLSEHQMEINATLLNAYMTVAGDTSATPPEAISRRLKNKLAYSMANTFVEAEFFHPSDEPPLQELYDEHHQVNPAYIHKQHPGSPLSREYSGWIPIPTEPGCSDAVCTPDVYSHPDYIGEALSFEPNEMGWQDVITVHVRHNLALLPGPARLLSRFVHDSHDGSDKIAETIETNSQSKETLYTWPLSAFASASNEGETSILRYTQQLGAQPPDSDTPPPPMIIDNSDKIGFAEHRFRFEESSGAPPGYRHNFHRATSPDGWAKWVFTGLSEGTYEVRGTWPHEDGLMMDADYTITDGYGTELATAIINQQLPPRGEEHGGVIWQHLANVTVTRSTLVVTLTASGNVIADAIWIEPVSASENDLK